MATRYFILLSVILAGLDQYTKFLAKSLVNPMDLKLLEAGEIGAVRNEIIPDFFYLTLNFNKGIAWGMLPEWSEYFTGFAILMVFVILWILRKLDKDEVWFKIALSFQMAGAIGNMADRLLYKKVTDFLDITLFPNANVNYTWTLFNKGFNFHLPYDWPIFNLADSFVVIGTVVLVIVLIFLREEPAPAAVAPAVAVAGGVSLTAHPSEDKFEDAEVEMTHPGNVEMEEALTEIPIDEDGEKLVPLEDADKAHPEEIKGLLGSAKQPKDETVKPDSGPATDPEKEKLHDLSKRPEQDK